MASEKEKSIVDFLKLVSPGSPLRVVIDDLIRSDLGTTIVFDNPELANQKIIEGGFKINSKFSSQRLFELCKMDGAIIISSDLRKILFANVLLTPDSSISSIETGTRHKSAERTAKQANTFVITVSERRRKTTLYYGPYRYNLKPTEELIRNVSTTLQLLEKQKELFSEFLNTLNILELTSLASVGDVCNVIQKAEIILRISESIRRDFTELGQEGNIMNIRFRELIKGVEKNLNEILKDYSSLSHKKSIDFMREISFNELLDSESIARGLIGKPLDENTQPKGYRFLESISTTSEETSQLIKKFKNLENILQANEKDINDILKDRSSIISEEIKNLREQILSRKVIY